MTQNPELGEFIAKSHTLDCAAASLKTAIQKRRQGEEPFVVRIAGFGSMGKSFFAARVAALFPSACVIQTDMAMPDREERRAKNLRNGDDPAFVDLVKIRNAVHQLITGNHIENVVYNHKNGKHEVIGMVAPSKLVIIDGTIALYDELDLSPIPSFGVFLDADSNQTRYALRHEVNMRERGYTKEGSEQIMPGILEAYYSHILPSKQNADIVYLVDRNRLYCSTAILNCVCPIPG